MGERYMENRYYFCNFGELKFFQNIFLKMRGQCTLSVLLKVHEDKHLKTVLSVILVLLD